MMSSMWGVRLPEAYHGGGEGHPAVIVPPMQPSPLRDTLCRRLSGGQRGFGANQSPCSCICSKDAAAPGCRARPHR